MSIDTDARSSGPPLDLDAAEKLDRRIQRMADTAVRNLAAFADVLAEAKTGQIHAALGYDSWTAYLAERLKPITRALDTDDRRVLVAELYEAGMSLRAIAEAVGTSKSTVARQVSQSGTGDLGGEAVKTTGTDGKAYSRRNGGGGHRGPLDAVMKLRRAGSAIANITGLEPDDAARQAAICELIGELLASIQPVTESN